MTHYGPRCREARLKYRVLEPILNMECHSICPLPKLHLDVMLVFNCEMLFTMVQAIGGGRAHCLRSNQQPVDHYEAVAEIDICTHSVDSEWDLGTQRSLVY